MKTDHPSWIALESPNKTTGRPKPVSGLVLHFTAAGSGKGSAEYFSKREVSWTETDKAGKKVVKTAKVSASAHLVIERTGEVYQCVSFKDTAWHAGPAKTWKGEPLVKGQNVNHWTIGIEIANWGKLTPVVTVAELGKVRTPPTKFTNYLGRAYTGAAPFYDAATKTYWEPYSDAQVQAVITATRITLAAYPGILRADITGHENIQKGKSDPGPAFPWETFFYEVFEDDGLLDSLNAVRDHDRA